MKANSASSAWQSPDLDLLTAARFFAAAWVVFHHIGYGPVPGGESISSAIQRFTEAGATGVKFFFILSGFILAHVYGGKTAIPFKGFLLARLARIYPMHLFALVVAIPQLLLGVREHLANHAGWVGGVIAGGKSAMVVGLVQAWTPGSALFWNGVSWSLSAELFFYALFPFVILGMRGFGTRALVLIVAACCLFESGREAAALSHPNLLWSFTPILRLPDFATGIALRLLMHRGLRLPLWTALPSLAVFLGLLVLKEPHWAAKAVLVHLSAGLTVVALARPRTTSRPSRAMSVFVLLGQASFGMYLLHIPVNTWRMILFPGSDHTHFPIYLAALVAISIATFLLVEDPARRWIRGWNRG